MVPGVDVSVRPFSSQPRVAQTIMLMACTGIVSVSGWYLTVYQ